MVKLVRHPQTKGRETDRPHLSHRATSRLYPLLTSRALQQFNQFLPDKGPDAWFSPTNLSAGEMAFLPVNKPVKDGVNIILNVMELIYAASAIQD